MEPTKEQQIDLILAEAEIKVDRIKKAQRAHELAMLCAKNAEEQGDDIPAAYNAAFKEVMDANHG